jgi:hypothetical protein
MGNYLGLYWIDDLKLYAITNSVCGRDKSSQWLRRAKVGDGRLPKIAVVMSYSLCKASSSLDLKLMSCFDTPRIPILADKCSSLGHET